MPTRSQRWKLTLSYRDGLPSGWVKRLGGRTHWIVSAREAPTGADADDVFERRFPELVAEANDPRARDSLRAALDNFIVGKRAEKRHAGTIKDYIDMARKLTAVIPETTSVSEVTAGQLLSFQRSLDDLGASRRQKLLICCRTFVKWASARLVVRVTPADIPLISKAEMRRERVHRIPFTPNQIRRLCKYGTDQQRLIILLGLNLCVGPDEMTKLTAADLKGPDFIRPRQKTGIRRQIPIWPELRAMLPKSGPLFSCLPQALTLSFRRLCRRTMTPAAHGIYHLRRTARTVADSYGDQRATALLMGRELPDTDSVYVLRIGRERLSGMMDHIRAQLRIAEALRARQYDEWVCGLEVRLRRRREGGKAAPTKRRGETSTAHPPCSQESAQPAPPPAASAPKHLAVPPRRQAAKPRVS